MHDRFLNRQVQMALYPLKRQYGAPVTLFHVLSRSVDTRTGEPTSRYRATRIRRAIVLPAKLMRMVDRNVSLISANKQVVSGGWIDTSKRVFLIERRDAPQLELEKDDFVVYRGDKYALESIEEYEFASAWLLVAKHLVGERFDYPLEQSLSAGDSVELVQQGDQIVEGTDG